MASTLSANTKAKAYGELSDRIDVTRFFGGGDFSPDRYLFGWAAPEENHNWNDGAEVGYLLKLSSVPHEACRIRVEGAPFVQANVPSQEVTLYANGLRLGSWTLTGDERVILEAEIEPEQWLVRDGAAIGKLRWHIPHSIAPGRIGFGSDERQLGFCFMSVTVTSG